jgi:hypothetical protein
MAQALSNKDTIAMRLRGKSPSSDSETRALTAERGVVELEQRLEVLSASLQASQASAISLEEKTSVLQRKLTDAENHESRLVADKKMTDSRLACRSM